MLKGNTAPADKTNVGERIRQIRKKKELTQKDFAGEIGFSKNQISKVENGKIIPSNKLLRRISDAFNVSMEWLMTGKGNIESVPQKVDSELIEALEAHPEVIRELRERFGL